MDVFILKQVDKLGDWMQETRGVRLPVALFNLGGLVFVGFVVLIVSMLLKDPGIPYLSVGSAVIMSAIWSPTLIRQKRRMDGYAGDFDRFDDPEVRVKYMTRALTERQLFGWIRNMYLVYSCAALVFWVTSKFLTILTMWTVGDLVFFWALTLQEYALCIIPKAPRVRRQEKLSQLPANMVLKRIRT